MGITLHAQIELHEPGDKRYSINPGWNDVARWDFGKDGNASTALFQCCMVKRGWPSDAQMDAEEWDTFDQGRQWIEANYLPIVRESRPIWDAFEASLLVLLTKTGREVRVLFWRM